MHTTPQTPQILPILTLLLTACASSPNASSSASSPGLPGEVSPSSATEGVFSSSYDQSTNLLQNPSLESPTPDPWFDFSDKSQSWYPYQISTNNPHTANHAAKLIINKHNTTPTAILGIVQEIPATSPTLPKFISGYYKVTDWTRGTKNQYLQTVIMATRPKNKPAGTNYPTYQLAIPLAGITEPPFKMGNRKFAFAPHNTPPADPVLNQWIHFEFNLQELYQHHWGFIPENSTSYKVFFEVRYDKKANNEHPLATVYFDDLYLGPDSRPPTPTPTPTQTSPAPK